MLMNRIKCFPIVKVISIIIVSLIVLIYTLNLYGNYSSGDRIQVDTGANIWWLRNANIVDVSQSGRFEGPHDILIEHGFIAKIVPSSVQTEVGIRDSFSSVDAQGSFVSPGLIDSHVHAEDSAYLALSLAEGVTTVRGMRGNLAQLSWRDEIASDQWLGSRFIVSSPIIDGESSDPFHQYSPDAEFVKARIKEYADDGYDWIKLYSNMSPEVYSEALEQAKTLNLKIAKHGPTAINGYTLDSLHGLDSVEHLEDVFSIAMQRQFNQSKLLELAQQYRQLDIPIVTTLAVYDELTELSVSKHIYLNEQPLRYMNTAHRQLTHLFGVQRWLDASIEQAQYNVKVRDYLLHIAKVFNDNGVRLIVGSDAGALVGQSGYALHHEMSLLSEAGLQNLEVLKAATINAATMLQIDDQVGSVQEGKVADLVITEFNPLSELTTLSKPKAVISKGRLLNRQDLVNLKKSAENTQWALVTYAMILWDFAVKQAHLLLS
jgi:hypothetical protein